MLFTVVSSFVDSQKPSSDEHEKTSSQHDRRAYRILWRIGACRSSPYLGDFTSGETARGNANKSAATIASILVACSPSAKRLSEYVKGADRVKEKTGHGLKQIGDYVSYSHSLNVALSGTP